MNKIFALVTSLFILGILANFYYVDKPRKPIIFVTATISACVAILTVWLLWGAYL